MDRQRQAWTDRDRQDRDKQRQTGQKQTDKADRDCAVPAVQMASAALDRQGAVGRLVQTG